MNNSTSNSTNAHLTSNEMNNRFSSRQNVSNNENRSYNQNMLVDRTVPVFTPPTEFSRDTVPVHNTDRPNSTQFTTGNSFSTNNVSFLTPVDSVKVELDRLNISAALRLIISYLFANYNYYCELCCGLTG